jgi:hypothetical protein
VSADPADAWLTKEEAAAHLRFPNARAFFEWQRVHRVRRAKAGKRCLWRRQDLDAAAEKAAGAATTERHFFGKARAAR